MKRYHVVHCKPEKVQKIKGALDAYNLAHVGAARNKSALLSLGAFSRKGKLIGGILGDIGCWNGMEVSTLWVDKKYRNRGIGTELLAQAEKWAIAEGATIVMVNTFSFQSVGFYQKQGYSNLGIIPDFSGGHQWVHFYKKLRDTTKLMICLDKA